jgi:hypothetical protein
VTFIDTPGFDDSYRDDAEILTLIVVWLQRFSYGRDKLLNGVIYLHRITDNKLAGAGVRTLGVLKRMCGTTNYQNIAIVTTMWDLLPNVGQGETRERALKQGADDYFWSNMIAKGAKTFRHYDIYETAMEVVKQFLPKTPVVLDIQEQLSTNGGIVARTAAGKFILDHLELQSQLHAKHLSDLRSQAVPNTEKLAVKSERDMKKIGEDIKYLQKSVDKLVEEAKALAASAEEASEASEASEAAKMAASTEEASETEEAAKIVSAEEASEAEVAAKTGKHKKRSGFLGRLLSNFTLTERKGKPD